MLEDWAYKNMSSYNQGSRNVLSKKHKVLAFTM